MRIIDISHYQKDVDFPKLKDVFIIHKCTEGTNYLDPRYNERKNKIQGSYHFAGGGNAINEADWYLKHANEDFLCLDWEIEHPNPVGWCKSFIDRVKEKTGKDCWFYTNDARALKYAFPKDWKFWIARYADYTGKYYPDFHPKFANWSIHQYTSRGRIDGIEGNVDMSVLKDGVTLNTNNMTSEHEKNYKKLANALADYVGEDFGNNPNNKETDKILEALEDKKDIEEEYEKDMEEALEKAKKELEETKQEAMDAVDRLNEKIENQAEMLKAKDAQISKLKESEKGELINHFSLGKWKIYIYK